MYKILFDLLTPKKYIPASQNSSANTDMAPPEPYSRNFESDAQEEEENPNERPKTQGIHQPTD